MKKVMYVMGFTLIPFILLGQVPQRINNVAGSGQAPPAVLDSLCNFTEEFVIKVANLDILNGVTCDANLQSLTLPSGYPDMKLRITINNVTEIIDVTTFDKRQCGSGANPSLFTFQYTKTVNMEETCELYPGYPNLFVSSELLEETSSGVYKAYPICSYTASGDLFDCGVFDETSDFCTPDDPDCDNNDLNTTSYTSWFYCFSSCYPAQGKSEEDVNADYSESNLEDSFSFEVSPNPFSSELFIRFKGDVINPVINIYDLNGKMIKSWSNHSQLQNEYLIWETTELPLGMYILHIQNNGITKFKKVIKSN